MRSLGWQNWRRRLSNLFRTVWDLPDARPPHRNRSSFPLGVEPLEDRLAPVVNLTVTTFDSPDPVVRGDTITYLIGVQNTGTTGNVNNLKLTDAIPQDTTFVSFMAPAGWTPVEQPSGGTVTSTRSEFHSWPAGHLVEFTLVVRVEPNTVTNPIQNQVTVDWRQLFVGENPPPINGSATDTEQTTVIGPDLSLTKADSPDPVARGDTLTYTITVTNPGPGNALNVSLTDTISLGTTFVSFTPPAGWTSTTPPVGETGTVTSTAVSMLPGNLDFTLVVRVNLSAPDTISNTATVTSLNDPNTLNDSDTEPTDVVSPDLTVTQTGAPGIVQRGDTITYTLTLNNVGPGNALNVTLTDVFPQGTTFVSVTAPDGFTTTPPTTDNTVVFSATSFSPGTAVFTLVVRVDATMISPFIQNRATVLSVNEIATTNNDAVAETAVVLPALPITGYEDTRTTYTVARFTSTLGIAFTALIDWGDGTTSPGVITKENPTTFVISGPHTYMDEAPHLPDLPLPFSVMVTGGGRRFDMNGTADIMDRPFVGGDRGSPDERWLAEIADNLRNPSTRSLNQDDAGRRAFANQWNTLLARELVRTRNLRKARRNVALRVLTRAIVTQITTEILGGVPRRLTGDQIARLIDAFYVRYLEHGGRSASWDVAFTTMRRLRRTESVIEAIRIPLAEFMSSDEFFNKTAR